MGKVNGQIRLREKISRTLKLENKKPVCENNRKIPLRIVYRNRTDGKDYSFDPGCGNIYTCLECARNYKIKHSIQYRELAKLIFDKYGKAQIAHLTLTLPSDHKNHRNARNIYRWFFKKVALFVKMYFRGTGFYIALHNWSSKDPCKLNIHAHVVIFGINSHGKKVNIWIDPKKAQLDWAKILNYNKLANLKLKYFKKNDLGKCLHAINYSWRSPISDYVKKYDVLKIEYLKLILQFYRLQRIRSYGWLSNSTKNETLNRLGIEQSKISNTDDLDMIGIGKVLEIKDDKLTILVYIENGFEEGYHTYFIPINRDRKLIEINKLKKVP